MFLIATVTLNPHSSVLSAYAYSVDFFVLLLYNDAFYVHAQCTCASDALKTFSVILWVSILCGVLFLYNFFLLICQFLSTFLNFLNWWFFCFFHMILPLLSIYLPCSLPALFHRSAAQFEFVSFIHDLDLPIHCFVDLFVLNSLFVTDCLLFRSLSHAWQPSYFFNLDCFTFFFLSLSFSLCFSLSLSLSLSLFLVPFYV